MFELNPGGLLQNGYALPLIVSRADGSDPVLRRCEALLKRSGSEIARPADQQEGFVYLLTLKREAGDRVGFRLRKGEQGRQVFSETVSLEPVGPRRQALALARVVVEQIYKVRK
jgi:hypothetical protein